MKRLMLLATVIMLSVTASADAAKKTKKSTQATPDLAAMFKKLDTNNDDSLSKEEFAKAATQGKKESADPAKVAKKAKKAKKAAKSGNGDAEFNKLDTTNDGKISLEEYKKYMAPAKAAKKKKTAS